MNVGKLCVHTNASHDKIETKNQLPRVLRYEYGPKLTKEEQRIPKIHVNLLQLL